MVKLIQKIINIVFIIIIVILAGYFILRLTGVVTIYRVETGSMESNIHINDYVLAMKQKEYKENDVITFKTKDIFVTHRIIKIEDNKIITKGDANNDEDEIIELNQITGKVIYTGGVLNFIINYKLVIVAVMLIIYLISCYINSLDKKAE